MAWPEIIELARTIADAAEEIEEAAGRRDSIGTLRRVNRVAELMPDLATDVVEMGIKEGLTQKALASALGVPASTLRGAKREFSR